VVVVAGLINHMNQAYTDNDDCSPIGDSLFLASLNLKLTCGTAADAAAAA